MNMNIASKNWVRTLQTLPS